MAKSDVEQSPHSCDDIPVQWKFRMVFEYPFCSEVQWTSGQQAVCSQYSFTFGSPKRELNSMALERDSEREDMIDIYK